MRILSNNYFTKDNFEYWLKLFKIAREYIYYRKPDDPWMRQFTHEESLEMSRINHQGKLIMHALLDIDKPTLKKLYKNKKDDLDMRS